jgi:hypothetical protein
MTTEPRKRRPQEKSGGQHQTIDEFLFDLVREEVDAGRMRPDEVGERVARALRAVHPRFAKSLAARLRKGAPEFLKSLRRDRDRFQLHIVGSWGRAIDALDLLNNVFREFGDQLFREGLEQNRLRHPTFRALADLHARACRVTGEILCLLSAGYSDGAYARWRTLHEIAVVSTVLSTHSRDLALRYLHHFYVKQANAAEAYQRHCQSLGGRPIPTRSYKAMLHRRDKACARFGRHYGSDWGWATPIVANGDRPRFYHLEQACALQSFRPMVATANDDVHAGPRGLMPSGVELHGRGFLLAGASDAGLAEPGANAAISLTHIAWARLKFAPSIEHGLTVDTLILLQGDCISKFDKAHQRVRELTVRNLAKQGLNRRGRKRAAATPGHDSNPSA